MPKTQNGEIDHTMAANMMKSSPCSLPVFRSLVAILVKVARHTTTRVIQFARLTKGPRLSEVILTDGSGMLLSLCEFSFPTADFRTVRMDII